MKMSHLIFCVCCSGTHAGTGAVPVPPVSAVHARPWHGGGAPHGCRFSSESCNVLRRGESHLRTCTQLA